MELKKNFSVTRLIHRVKLSHPNWCYFFAILLIAIMIYRWPIHVIDQDLWYNLSAGKFFVNNLTIPDTSSYSFLTPVRKGINYYWLFQFIVYFIYIIGQYWGLLLLRTGLYLTTIVIILFYIRQNNVKYTARPIFFLIFMLYSFLIVPRCLNLRPHIFSYLFILSIIFVLEYKRKYIWTLPIQTIVWMNIHGIMFPVLLLILGAYWSDAVLDRFRRKKIFLDLGEQYRLIIIISMFCIFLTPIGISILEAPFKNGPLQYMYNSELKPLGKEVLLNFSFDFTFEFPYRLQILQFYVVNCSIIYAFYRRNYRISHTFLWIGSLLLLRMHQRFIYEFLLLTLPIFIDFLGLLKYEIIDSRKSITNLISMYLILGLFAIFYFGLLFDRPKHPFSRINSPQGVAIFLNKVGKGGNVLNNPNSGGYLQWILNNKYKIYADLQLVMFSDYDIFLGINAFDNIKVFRYLRNTYSPSYLVIPLMNGYTSPVLREYPNYVPIFFDEAHVLYVDREKETDIADQYVIRSLNPYKYFGLDYNHMYRKHKQQIASEMNRILGIDSENLPALVVLGQLLISEDHSDGAELLANRILLEYPESPYGYFLLAQIFQVKSNFLLAESEYLTALSKMPVTSSTVIPLNLYRLYHNTKQYTKAYKLLTDYINPFLTDNYQDAFNYTIAATLAGDHGIAKLLIPICKMKIPDYETVLLKKLDDIDNAYKGK